MAERLLRGGKMFRSIERLRNDERGFTLIELLIVIVILGILAGIVIFAVAGITDRGNAAACKSDRKTIEVAVEAYRAKNGGYPANLDPTLTTAPNQFLRADPNLTGSTKTGDGYTITYASDGSVTASGACT
jgi:prepilin-type N-terminal cleavage/methylation domain-containing protein